MAERKIAPADDPDEGKMEVMLGGSYNRTIEHDADPFAVTGQDLKKFEGLSPSLRRKVAREIQKSFTGTGGAKTKKYELESISGYNIFGTIMPPFNLYYLAKLYEASAPHYGAVKAKVANIVGLGYDLIESPKTRDKMSAIAEGQKESARRKLAKGKSDLFDWLDSCNSEDEFVETLIKIWTDYETTGNGYIEVGRTTSGDIGYIGHISAPTMRIRRERDGYVQVISNRAVFFRNFGEKVADPVGTDPRPNEIIHLKKYSPTSNFYGVPDIVSATQAVAGNEFASRFNLDYFENKAVPRYVIVIKGGNLSSTAERNMLEFFQTGLKGKNHRTLYVPLPAEVDGHKVSFEMNPVEAGTQDSSFINYRKQNIDDILLAHRVPLSKLGGTNDATLAAAKDLDKTFKEQVCRPEQQILEKKLQRIFKEKTDAFMFKLNELTLTDEDTLSQMDQRYILAQVMVPNDIRVRRWGWDALPEGDKIVDLKPQQAADQANNAKGTDARAQDRSANAPDKQGESRQAKGEGRATK